jgi:hypothetical protein
MMSSVLARSPPFAGRERDGLTFAVPSGNLRAKMEMLRLQWARKPLREAEVENSRTKSL